MKGSRNDVKTYALRLLAYRSRSRKEMLERLRGKGFESDQINTVITSLEDTGLLNDKVLSSDLFRYAIERKSLGRQGIRMFLAKRGIEKDLIESTLSTHTDEGDEKAALEFAERKLKTLKKHPDDVVKRRLWGMLQRRGFSAGVIRKVIGLVI